MRRNSFSMRPNLETNLNFNGVGGGGRIVCKRLMFTNSSALHDDDGEHRDSIIPPSSPLSTLRVRRATANRVEDALNEVVRLNETSLNLSRHGLTSEGATPLLDAFECGALKKIQALDLSYNNLGPILHDILELVGVSGSVKALSLGGNSLCEHGLQQIAAELIHIRSLVRLRLFFNNITSADIGDFCGQYNRLGIVTPLQALDLSYNLIDARGARFLREAICLRSGGLARLRELNLSNNRLGDDGVRELFALLMTSENELAPSSRLEAVNLSSNDVTDTGVEYLCSYMEKYGDDCVLSELQLFDNRITAEGAELLRHVKANVKRGVSIWLGGNDVPKRVVLALCEVYRTVPESHAHTTTVNPDGSATSSTVTVPGKRRRSMSKFRSNVLEKHGSRGSLPEDTDVSRAHTVAFHDSEMNTDMAFHHPKGVAVHEASGWVFVSDSWNHRIVCRHPVSGVSTVLLGGDSGSGVTLRYPMGMYICTASDEPEGSPIWFLSLFICDYDQDRILRVDVEIDRSLSLSSIPYVESIRPMSIDLRHPFDISGDSTGAALYISDAGYSRIVVYDRLRARSSTLMGVAGKSADERRPRQSTVIQTAGFLSGLAFCSMTRRLYVCDCENDCVYMVDIDADIVHTVDGLDIDYETSGPMGVAVDETQQRAWLVDCNNNSIVEYDVEEDGCTWRKHRVLVKGVVQGPDTMEITGDVVGIPEVHGQLRWPMFVAHDALRQRLLVSDVLNHRVVSISVPRRTVASMSTTPASVALYTPHSMQSAGAAPVDGSFDPVAAMAENSTRVQAAATGYYHPGDALAPAPLPPRERERERDREREREREIPIQQDPEVNPDVITTQTQTDETASLDISMGSESERVPIATQTVSTGTDPLVTEEAATGERERERESEIEVAGAGEAVEVPVAEDDSMLNYSASVVSEPVLSSHPVDPNAIPEANLEEISCTLPGQTPLTDNHSSRRSSVASAGGERERESERVREKERERETEAARERSGSLNSAPQHSIETYMSETHSPPQHPSRATRSTSQTSNTSAQQQQSRKNSRTQRARSVRATHRCVALMQVLRVAGFAATRRMNKSELAAEMKNNPVFGVWRKHSSIRMMKLFEILEAESTLLKADADDQTPSATFLSRTTLHALSAALRVVEVARLEPDRFDSVADMRSQLEDADADVNAAIREYMDRSGALLKSRNSGDVNENVLEAIETVTEAFAKLSSKANSGCKCVVM